MITFFTCPKPFRGHINVIQRNAILSWLNEEPECEILLFGDEPGVKEFAEEFHLKHISEVKKNEFGRPYINDIFSSAQKIAKNDVLAYVNADIILIGGIYEAVKKTKFSSFLLSGRRQDLEVKEDIDFNDKKWKQKILEEAEKNGKLHGYSGIDFFVFPKNFLNTLPSFTIGVAGWDNWLIYNTKKQGVPVIDATEAIKAIHQNHDYSFSSFGNEKNKRIEGPELEKNILLAGGYSKMLTLREADWILTKKGIEKPRFPRNIFSKLSSSYVFREVFSLKRKIQNIWK